MHKKIGQALVVGAGISGIRVALDLAETGYGVTLIDKAPHMGGILSQLDYQFPSNRCGMCKMLPLVDRDAASQYCLRKGLFHDNIEILLSTELIAVRGDVGNYGVRLKQKSNRVNPRRCMGCGMCVDVCPVEVPDEFNAGLTKRKAVYLPVPHAIPNSFMIDTSACTRCGECEKICPTGAIQLSAQARSEFKILVVDDEDDIRLFYSALLEDNGATVIQAPDGEEALKLAKSEKPDLITLDLHMPGKDGGEVFELIRKDPELAETKVCIITGKPELRRLIYDRQVTPPEGFLDKPVDDHKLLLNIRKILEVD